MAGEGTRRSGSGRRVAVAAVALAGWVLVVVVAGGRRPDDRTWIGLPALDDLMGIAFVGLIVWAIVWTARVLRVGPGPKQTRPANLVTLWLGLALAIAVVMANPSIVERLLETEPARVSEPDVDELADEEAPAPVDFEITARQVYLVLAALVVWLGVTAASRRRTEAERDEEAVTQPVDAEDLSRTVDGMVDDLELGTDPRAAVLTAYSRLERALADHDRARRLTETAAEHLDRVLATLPIDRSPFLDLARRYELARFSDHPITEADRDRAATDLARARDDLSRSKSR